MSEPEKKKIEGIYTPLLVPMDEHGQIDEAEMRRHINWLIKGGVHGLYPNGSSGEFTRFTPAERRRITQMVVDETAGRVPSSPAPPKPMSTRRSPPARPMPKWAPARSPSSRRFTTS